MFSLKRRYMSMYQALRHHIREHSTVHILYLENLENLPSIQLRTREYNRSDYKKSWNK